MLGTGVISEHLYALYQKIYICLSLEQYYRCLLAMVKHNKAFCDREVAQIGAVGGAEEQNHFKVKSSGR